MRLDVLFISLGFFYATSSVYTPKKEHLTGFKDFIDELRRSLPNRFRQISNNYIDNYLLKDLTNYITEQKHDSVEVLIFNFSISVLGHTGLITLDKGWMQGFGNLRRHRKVIIKEYDEKFKLKVSLIYDNLVGGYTYLARVNNFEDLKGVTNGSCKNSKITLNLVINKDNYRVDLNEIFIDIGNIEADYVGNFVGHLPNYMIDTYLPMVKVTIMSLIQKYMVDDLTYLIEQHNKYACHLTDECIL